MFYIFYILGIIGLCISCAFIAVFFLDYEIFDLYFRASDLGDIYPVLLGSLVFLAIARILKQLNDLHERMQEQDSATKVFLNKDFGNWPPSA